MVPCTRPVPWLHFVFGSSSSFHAISFNFLWSKLLFTAVILKQVRSQSDATLLLCWHCCSVAPLLHMNQNSAEGNKRGRTKFYLTHGPIIPVTTHTQTHTPDVFLHYYNIITTKLQYYNLFYGIITTLLLHYHCVTITLYYIIFHYITLYYNRLDYIRLHQITLYCIILHYIIYIKLNYIKNIK